jgi:putative hydrolase of the HAD superfamily
MLVLFDIDDTLIDHSSAVRAGLASLHRELGVQAPLEEFVVSWIGSHARHYPRFLAEGASYADIRRARVRDVLGSALDDETADAIFSSYFAAYEARWSLFADARRSLDRLVSRHRLGVVSNGPSREQRRKLDKTGIARTWVSRPRLRPMSATTTTSTPLRPDAQD